LKRVLIIAFLILTVVAGASPAYASHHFSAASKRAVFLSPLEQWEPTYDMDQYVSVLQNAGYHVDVMLNSAVSIAFLRTGLAKYDLIILRTDSFYYEGLNFYCAGDKVTTSTRSAFANEISAHEIRVAACLGFSMIFVQQSYPAGSLHGLVYVPGSVTTDLAGPFLAAGASVFIGYDVDMSPGWGRLDLLSIKMLGYLAQGYGVSDTLIELLIYLHTGHGDTADWTLPVWAGDGDFKI
jgi:hypothetical protein